MTKKNMSRLVSMFLALMLSISLFPVQAYAAPATGNVHIEVDGLSWTGDTAVAVGKKVTCILAYGDITVDKDDINVEKFEGSAGLTPDGDIRIDRTDENDPWYIEQDFIVNNEGTHSIDAIVKCGADVQTYNISFEAANPTVDVFSFESIASAEDRKDDAEKFYAGEDVQLVVYYAINNIGVLDGISNADETTDFKSLTWTSSNPAAVSINVKTGLLHVNAPSVDKVVISVAGVDKNGTAITAREWEISALEAKKPDNPGGGGPVDPADPTDPVTSYNLTLDAGEGVFTISGKEEKELVVKVEKNADGRFEYDLLTTLPVLREADGTEHAFLVWKDDKGNEVKGAGGIISLTKNLTLVAEYEKDAADEYVIRFNANGGVFTGGGSNALTADVKFNVPTYKISDFTEVPSYTGHDFLGWFDSPDEGSRDMTNETVDFATPGMYTVYAHWKKTAADEFKVTWIAKFDKDKTDVTLKTAVFKKGYTVQVSDYPTLPKYDGYVLDTWVEPVENSKTGDLTIVAQHKKAVGDWTVVWMNGYVLGDAGKLSEAKTNDPEKIPEYPNPLPIRAGWKFVKWTVASKDETKKVITIIAQWEKAADTTYTITHRYLYNGRVVGTVEVVKAGVPGATVTASSIAKQVRYRGMSFVFDRASADSIKIEEGNKSGIILIYNYKTPVTPITPGGQNPNPTPNPQPNQQRFIPMSKLNQNTHMAYVNGYNDGLMHPEAPITRAEAAQIFYNILNASEQKIGRNEKSKFSDVTDKSWYLNPVIVLNRLKVIEGYPNGTFGGSNNITNAEFVTMAVRFLETNVTSGSGFPDTRGHWAENQVKLAQGAGWISGYADGLFHPDTLITRAEVIAIVNKMLGRSNVSENGMISSMRTWSDVSKDKWYYLDVQEASNAHTYKIDADGMTETWEKLSK